MSGRVVSAAEKPTSPALVQTRRIAITGITVDFGRSEVAMRRRTHTQWLMPCQARSAVGAQPNWDLECTGFGDVAIGRFAGDAHALEATPADTDRSPAGILVDVVMRGSYQLTQDARTGVVGPGDAVICYNRMPFQAAGPVPSETRSVMLPATVLTRHFGDLSRLAAVVLSARCPAVVLLGAYLRGLPLGPDAPDAAARDMIGRHVVDLLVSAIGNCVGSDDRGQGSGVRAARADMIKRLIEQQIAQPNLNAARIGRHFGVSDRYVQKLLEQAGTTFSAYVMERRLSIARLRLGDPAFAGMSVRDVAFSAGFSDPAHFARSFRRRFGETPTSVRLSRDCGEVLIATG